MFQVSPNRKDYIMSHEEPLPPRSVFNSPLKKRKPITETALRSVGKCDFSSPKKLKLNDGTSIIPKAYPEHNLDYIERLPPVYQSQVFGIEHCLKLSSRPPDQKCSIRDKMMHIIKNNFLSIEDKLAELGILYYYLASGKTIPSENTHSLLSLRLEAIERETMELKQIHKGSCRGKSVDILPSGCTTYLLSTFSRMIFPPNGGFNLGGCHAIKALLNSRLSLLLTEEMRTQILSVVECLIKDPEFLQLFLEPFKVHHSMEQLICLDLKIPFGEEMNFVYVRWCLLTALFSPMGQMAKEANCYAVAPTMNLLSVGKKVLVKLMIEIVSTGHFSFEEHSIPILPLMETRRRYEGQDFEIQMTIEQAHELTPYNVASFALHTPTTPSEEMGDAQKSLGEWIDFEFMDTAQSAREYFISHKVSRLLQTATAALQFSLQNSRKPKEERYGWRFKIFFDMMRHIHTCLKKQSSYLSIKEDPDFIAFLQNWFKHLLSDIFVVDFNHSHFTIEEGKVIYDFQSQGLVFNGNHKDYMPFLATRRVMRLSQGAFKPIDKLSDFIEHCRESLDAATPQQMSPNLKIGQNLLEEYIKHSSFRKNMARQVAYSNRSFSKFEWEIYDKSDALFFIQGGGKSRLVDGLKVLEDRFLKWETIHSENLTDFYNNICRFLLDKFFKEELGGDFNTDPQLLMSYFGHVLNLTPFRFSSFWKNSDPIEALKTRVTIPGIKLRHKVLSRDEMTRALRYVDGLSIDEEFVDECIESEQVTVAAFNAKVKEILDEEDHMEFDEALSDVAREFTLASLEGSFPKVLLSLDVRLTEGEYQEVIDYVKKNEKSKFFLTPFIAGTLIHEALANCSKSIIIPLRIIEEILCRCFGLPEWIELGNLNWTESFSERLNYRCLGLTFDIFKGLVLCKKMGGEITFFDREKAQDIYKEVSICSNPSSINSNVAKKLTF